jgi:hypothetical protein
LDIDNERRPPNEAMKQMEIEYEASIAKLEQKAKEGILVREEKLKELKNEKRAISLELK